MDSLIKHPDILWQAGSRQTKHTIQASETPSKMFKHLRFSSTDRDRDPKCGLKNNHGALGLRSQVPSWWEVYRYPQAPAHHSLTLRMEMHRPWWSTLASSRWLSSLALFSWQILPGWSCLINIFSSAQAAKETQPKHVPCLCGFDTWGWPGGQFWPEILVELQDGLIHGQNVKCQPAWKGGSSCKIEYQPCLWMNIGNSRGLNLLDHTWLRHKAAI